MEACGAFRASLIYSKHFVGGNLEEEIIAIFLERCLKRLLQTENCPDAESPHKLVIVALRSSTNFSITNLASTLS